MDRRFTHFDKELKPLVELGAKGHFPLFHSTWIEEIFEDKMNSRKSSTRLTDKEKRIAKKILNRLAKHQGLDRKKTIIHALEEDERKHFIKAFLKMVESNILDRGLELQ